MTQSMESQTMLPAQHEDVEDKRKTCPVRAWAEQHKPLLIVCFGVLGVFLLLMLGNRKTVLNIAADARQPQDRAEHREPAVAGRWQHGESDGHRQPWILDVPVDLHRQWFPQPPDEQRQYHLLRFTSGRPTAPSRASNAESSHGRS